MFIMKPVFVGILFICIMFCHHHLGTPVSGGEIPAHPLYYSSDIAMDCGSNGNSTALDGREWVGEAASKLISGKSRSSIAVTRCSADSVPYKTSRISATEFRYTFLVSPGQKFIRLHFFPASYHGFENSIDYFSVTAGPFTLLRDYSPSVTADSLKVNYLVKEFCMNVGERKQLNITFSPSRTCYIKKKVHAFVNGIEIISMPTGLYYTNEHESGARIVGLRNRFYVVDNSTALEVIQRFNVGGRTILPVEDFGMFRRWDEDIKYLLEPRAHRMNHLVLKIKYANIPSFIAPPQIYQTFWKAEISKGVNQLYNFTWKVPVALGFGYLIRFHFCDLDSNMAERVPREFNVVINIHIAETKADVIRWSGSVGVPVYKDYVVIMKGDKEGSKSDLLIGLQSVDELVFGFLNGLEIFKLSNLENSLAAPNLGFPRKLPTSWNLKTKILFSVFERINIFGTLMTILTILLTVMTNCLRKIWEKHFHYEQDALSASAELSYRYFSLAEIKLATQNFSDAFVIGRGGFGKVYKGYIGGIPEIVAIKRLNSYSKQGAREFWTEIETLSKLRHIHLVSLIGYCNEFQEMIIVYEYIPSGTLADNLYKFTRKGRDCPPLSWEQRLRICIGAARGLDYLHTGSEYGVIHRDVKDTNILLDENLVAKISDFGLSKLEKVTQSKGYVSTNVKGTFGYLDPDYFSTHRLTRKSDVYAFGMVMLVVLSGRPALDTRIHGEPQSLLACFRECMAEDDLTKIVDPILLGAISLNRLREFVKIVDNCLRPVPKKRPTMAQVVATLEQAFEQHRNPLKSDTEEGILVGNSCEVTETILSFQLNQQEAPIHEESVISPPKEEITSTAIANLGSPSRGKDSEPRGEDHALFRKLLQDWPWTAFWNKWNKRNSEESFFEELPLYDFETLAVATDHFDVQNKLSGDNVGAVYKGVLSNGQEIVVNFLYNFVHLTDVEFKKEVSLICKLKHPNLVRLVGCCVESRMLINEHMPTGILHAYLFDPKTRHLVDWSRRKIIIEGIARGLLCLHKYSRMNIIHGDLCAGNVLLDKELNPKLINYGSDEVHRRNRPNAFIFMGEDGYMPPAFAGRGLFPKKADVYSYGVLLLEIVSGQRNLECGSGTEYFSPLVEWARKL